ncbi:response regulator [Aliivibrio sp. S4TY2]|uniref:response regulator n=1 Tax=unclassified Aliivibrio TaxID=2645654 RepID=UPI002379BDAB|nr:MULTISPECIES: response regulator [unclassified Aliivibrio]MDD9155102.1 response regulator [Aliivibrio sp. S4TY2]MDD9159346.1 response regulator [Aliivibrio sp. S4TY1]MDD9163104.1 response regulator [Aliivibrio sp. S4MY2]MDD9167345.1 response regulator [Aliivibrio sp. S4MY4]MDD9184181.1 response regulator [Aliivibrio sp. S4MY3]
MNALKNQNKHNVKQFSILIVDDCLVSSLYLSKLLALLGFNSIDHVKTYQQAIKSCSKKRYSLLFIDYHLEQVLNGSELYDLLKMKGFIEPYTRVITVSGDNTTQTVLSTLSKGNGDYLCKPISKSILSHKMKNAYQEFHLFKKLYTIEKKGDHEKLKEYAISVAKNKNINELDQLLFKLFSSNEGEELIALCKQPEFSNRRNYIHTRLHLENTLYRNTPQLLIKQAETLCQQHPLFAPAFDFLSQLHLQQSHYEEALTSAYNALGLTPSVPLRALHTLKLALVCNNKHYFLKASHLLANHLPIADQDWCTYVAKAFNYYGEYIQNCESVRDKKQFILEQKNFVRRSEYRLTAIQKKQLTILFSFSECKRMIKKGDLITAKRIMLKASKPFFDDLHQLNSVILVELLYLLSFYGELWLLERVNAVIKTKHQFNDYCLDALHILKHDQELNESLKMLSSTLNESNKIKTANLTTDDLELKQHQYQNALTQYPYSSELCISLLECYISLSIDNPATISSMVAAIQNMPLSDKLMIRREAIFKALHAHEGYIKEKGSSKLPNSYMKKDKEILNFPHKSATKLLL